MSARRGSAPRLVAGTAAIAIAALTLAGQALAAAETADAAYVRVDQVGYVASAHKRAYLLAGGSAAGATFAVRTLRAPASTRLASGRAPGHGAGAFPTSTAWTSTPSARPGRTRSSSAGPRTRRRPRSGSMPPPACSSR